MLFALSAALYRHGRAVIAVAVLVTLARAATMIGSESYRDAVGLSLFSGMVLAFAGSLDDRFQGMRDSKEARGRP